MLFIDILTSSDSLLSAERSVGMRPMSQNMRIFELIYGNLFSESSGDHEKWKFLQWELRACGWIVNSKSVRVDPCDTV